jgi:hypothetical protein
VRRSPHQTGALPAGPACATPEWNGKLAHLALASRAVSTVSMACNWTASHYDTHYTQARWGAGDLSELECHALASFLAHSTAPAHVDQPCSSRLVVMSAA